jgi:hypothetical protein
MAISDNKEVRIGDFVVLTKSIGEIVVNSVGIVKSKSENRLNVFFIGLSKETKVESACLKFLDLTKTGKPYKYKVCNICHVLKDYYDDFEINQTDASGRKTTRPSCRECRKQIDGVALRPEERRRLDSIKPKDYFVCPICEKGSIPGVTANLVRDHDHETGMGRAWLCDSCNTGLGRFKDNRELLEKAIKYLESYSSLSN